MVWDPARITARSWAEVVDFYRSIAERNDDFRPMRLLAEHVAARPDRLSLEAATSGTALLVRRRRGPGRSDARLRIDVQFDASIRVVIEADAPGRATVTSCAPENLVATFEATLKP